jgi:hypothetical protein
VSLDRHHAGLGYDALLARILSIKEYQATWRVGGV